MHVKTQTALTFPKLMTIELGQVGDDCPYWAIRNAIAFSTDARGNLTMLAVWDDWYKRHALPHHVCRYTDNHSKASEFFGADDRRLTVCPIGTDFERWFLVSGNADAFNPHFWESSVLPID